MSLLRKYSVAWGNPLSPLNPLSYWKAPVTSTLGVLVASGRLSSCEMPVVTAMINGQSVLCLVDTSSGCTMVSTRSQYLTKTGLLVSQSRFIAVLVSTSVLVSKVYTRSTLRRFRAGSFRVVGWLNVMDPREGCYPFPDCCSTNQGRTM